MFRYGKKSDYGTLVSPEASTKLYQWHFLHEHLPRWATPGARVLEIGAGAAFGHLLALNVAERWVADPYDGLAGEGPQQIPPHPQEIIISRCAIGVNSQALPSDFFDLVFSCSVLEHVGQREVGYDCRPTACPPAAQEIPRNNLCAELNRITKVGGIHIHTIDHAARNVSYASNFLNAGFSFLQNDPPISVPDMMLDPDAVRQTRLWDDPARPLPNPELHTVLILGFRKAQSLPVVTVSARPRSSASRGPLLSFLRRLI